MKVKNPKARHKAVRPQHTKAVKRLLNVVKDAGTNNRQESDDGNIKVKSVLFRENITEWNPCPNYKNEVITMTLLYKI
jgi:hypothetical protein